MSLGSRIKEYRLKRGYTQSQMAEKLNMTEANFSSYERDKSIPPSERLNQIALILDVSTDYLLGQTNDPKGIMDEEFKDVSPEVRIIQRAAKNMSQEERKRMLEMMKLAFVKAFSEDE